MSLNTTGSFQVPLLWSPHIIPWHSHIACCSQLVSIIIVVTGNKHHDKVTNLLQLLRCACPSRLYTGLKFVNLMLHRCCNAFQMVAQSRMCAAQALASAAPLAGCSAAVQLSKGGGWYTDIRQQGMGVTRTDTVHSSIFDQPPWLPLVRSFLSKFDYGRQG